MQTISKTLLVGTEEHRWCDEYGANANPPRVIIGTMARLVIDLRADLGHGDDQLPPYDAAQFDGAASWYFALDTDYDQATIPPFLRTTGISVATDADGRTVLSAELPDTDCAAIRSALASGESLQFRGEIAALDSNGNTIVCLQFPVRLVNRVWIGGEVPAEVENDPAYLTSAQVQALVASAVASAVAAATEGLRGDPGDPGEKGDPPAISIGSVTTLAAGENATAELLDGEEEGEYILNLGIPAGEIGAVPSIAVGSVSSGAAAASIAPDGNGGYTLSLTIPPGTGIVPVDGGWSGLETYPRGAAVRHNGAWWYSRDNGNLGHEPPASRETDEHWQLIVRDGDTPNGLTLAYAPTSTGAWHSAPIRATDLWFRISEDGGANWSIAIPLAQPAVSIAHRFSPADTDYASVTAGTAYSAGTGRHLQVITGLGVVSSSVDLGEAAADQEIRFLFTADGLSWHPSPQPADVQMHAFTADSAVNSYFNLNIPANDTFADVQTCVIADPWHADYREGDLFMRISQDNGATWSQTIPLRGDKGDPGADGADGLSAYQLWLAAGNTGTLADFLASLVGQGLRFDQAGTLAGRDDYDDAQAGFVYAATDLYTDTENGSRYQLFYYKRSDAEADWSDGLRITTGPRGERGATGATGSPGAPGPAGQDGEVTAAAARKLAKKAALILG